MPTLRRTIAASALFTILLSVAPIGQQQATVKRDVNLRPTPSSAEGAIRLLAPPESVDVIEPNPTEGYYRVRTQVGEEGRLWGRNLTLGQFIGLWEDTIEPFDFLRQMTTFRVEGGEPWETCVGAESFRSAVHGQTLGRLRSPGRAGPPRLKRIRHGC